MKKRDFDKLSIENKIAVSFLFVLAILTSLCFITACASFLFALIGEI